MGEVVSLEKWKQQERWTPGKLRGELERVGISQRAFAKMLGLDERTVRRWCDARRDSELSRGASAIIEAGFNRVAGSDENLNGAKGGAKGSAVGGAKEAVGSPLARDSGAGGMVAPETEKGRQDGP